MTPNMWGKVFKLLREGQGLTQQAMANLLTAQGVQITSRFGVSHLEERGTQQYKVINAYSKIFDKKHEELEALASEAIQGLVNA